MEMKYLLKDASVFASGLRFKYEKPATCPHCGYGTDATFQSKAVHDFNGKKLLVATCKCTSCQKTFMFAVEGGDTATSSCSCIYPAPSSSEYFNDKLSAISERFIIIYNQALRAEFNGDYELAATGMRSALEILIKDYAIKELNQPKEEVAKKDLFKAISEYLKQPELISTADVIRILGNDYTHYDRKYPQHDFELLKGYMDIFLKQIEVQYMISHPPVFRTP